jgi:protein required for attachment to host cells
MRNHGDGARLDLRVMEVMTDQENPRTAQQGVDQPGRVQNSIDQRRSAVEQTDWHARQEAKFSRSVGERLNELDRVGDVTSLIVVAPPEALADLRRGWPAALQRKIVAEISKDLTKHPIPEIEKILSAR